MNAVLPISTTAPPTMGIDEIVIGKRFRKAMGDITALATSIQDVGLLHPIVVRPDGTLIAGERRLRAFQQLARTEIPVTVIDLDVVRRGEYAENFFREAFTSSEMVAIADAIEPEQRKAAKERQREGSRRGGEGSGKFPEASSKGQSLDHVARIVGKDRKTITKARAVVKAAAKNPRKFAAIKEQMDKTGKVDGAFRKVKAEERKADIEQRAATVPMAADRYRLILGSVDKLMDEPAGSIDFIITDPPYPEKFLPLFGNLVRAAGHVLKPGGLMICMSGQAYLPRVYAELDAGPLNYLWTLAYLTPGGQATQVFPRRVNTFWKPVLVYSQGDYSGEWYGDVTRSDVNDNDKNHHDWGQSASGMRDLMQRFVKPGAIVADPFLGGGTTALVALDLGCTFLGFDVDQAAIDATRARLPHG